MKVLGAVSIQTSKSSITNSSQITTCSVVFKILEN